jgi:N-(2-amino-2-carboxyethyl)-L-glutamate synthase
VRSFLDPMRAADKPPIRIGNTPIVTVQLPVQHHSHAISFKLEGANPFGSIKDRVAWRLLSAARRSHAGGAMSRVIDTSSGNLGAALAGLSALLGLQATIVCPPSVTAFNTRVIRSHGAELLLVRANDGESLHEARARVARAVATEVGAVFLDQYHNANNWRTHSEWTAPETLDAFEGNAVFVCASSGGTARGFAEYLRGAGRADGGLKLVVVDSSGSNVLEPPQAMIAPNIPGFGSGTRSAFSPLGHEYTLVRVADSDAFWAFRELNAAGINVLGISSCALLVGVLDWLCRRDTPQHVVCICPDGAEKYAEYLRPGQTSETPMPRRVLDSVWQAFLSAGHPLRARLTHPNTP